MAKDLKTVMRARQLRREMTKPEVMLWRYLRGNPEGIRFRRQHPIGPYILDFFCSKAMLAIEIDGIVHDMGDQPLRDEARNEWLKEQGIMTIRISAGDVLRDALIVADSIVRFALSRRR